MKKDNIDDILYDTIKQHSESIKTPPSLKNNVYHEINEKIFVEQSSKMQKAKINSILRYSLVAIVALILGFSLNKGSVQPPIANNQVNLTKGEYIQLVSYTSVPVTDINKLYPKYIPEDFKMYHRYAFDNDKKIEMYFSANIPNKVISPRFSVIIANNLINDLSDNSNEKLQLESGLAYLKASYIEGDIIESGRLIFHINNEVTIIIDVDNVLKEELIKIANSFQYTEERLPNHVNDQDLMKLVREKLFGAEFHDITVERAIEIVEGANLPLKILEAENENKRDVPLVGFTVRDGIVYLFHPSGKGQYKSMY